MNVKIEVIPHNDHRYPTAGDWFYDQDGNIIIRISKLSDWKREMLVAVHELVEVLLCKNDGVSQEVTDEFDKSFESNRKPDNDEEPGDDPNAPYVKQHCIATGVERVMAAELGVSWKEYEQELSELP